MQAKKKVLLLTCLAMLLLAIPVAIIIHRHNEQAAYQKRVDFYYKQLKPYDSAIHAAMKKVRRKADELDKAGVKGEKRKQLIIAEGKAADRELDRVRATGYKSPYNIDAR